MMPFDFFTGYQPNPLYNPIAGPPIDTDPNSPTFGQPTGNNLRIPPGGVPDTGTTAKGNAGYPAPSVPTTAAPNAPPPQAVGNEPGGGISYKFVPPAPAKPAAAAPAKPAAEAPNYITGFKPRVDDEGKSLAPATPASTAPAAPSDTPNYITNFQPKVDDQGKPIQPVDTGEYLTSGTSAGARAVGTTPAEGRVPGVAFQTAINWSQDPAQRARIAANILNIPLDNIIFDGTGRMAAVDDKGQPYYIEPQPVARGPMSGSEYTRPLSNIVPSNITPGNLVRGGAAEIPNAVTSGLSFAPAVASEALGPATPFAVGGATLAANALRQGVANLLDPDRREAPGYVTWPGAEQAGINMLASALPLPFLPGRSDIIGRSGFSWTNRTVPIEYPLGAEGGGRLPWENPLRTDLVPTEPRAALPVTGLSEPVSALTPAVPGIAPAARADVNLNPAGEAAAPSGPYAASTPAEIARIPETIMPPRMPILTQGAADNRADQIVRHFAQGGPLDLDQRELVPNSPATLAQRSGNAGLASLERTLRLDPDLKNIFERLDRQQADARTAFVQDLVKTPADLEQAIAARKAATSQAREAAFSNATPTDASAAVDEIDHVLAGPEGKRSGVAGPLQRLRASFFDADGNLETHPRMLYGVRQNITDALSPLARGTESDARAASAQLQPVLEKLDAAIEAGAPGYKAYMTQFNEMSQPINAMEYLQSRNLTDATTGAPLLRPIDTTLKDIQKQRSLQPGVRPADALSDDQIRALQELRDDLRRQANTAKGKALGSNTAENFAGARTLNMLTRPVPQVLGRVGSSVFGPLGTGLEQLGEMGARGVSARAERMVKEALVRRVLNVNGLGERALQVNP